MSLYYHDENIGSEFTFEQLKDLLLNKENAKFYSITKNYEDMIIQMPDDEYFKYIEVLYPPSVKSYSERLVTKLVEANQITKLARVRIHEDKFRLGCFCPTSFSSEVASLMVESDEFNKILDGFIMSCVLGGQLNIIQHLIEAGAIEKIGIRELLEDLSRYGCRTPCTRLIRSRIDSLRQNINGQKQNR